MAAEEFTQAMNGVREFNRLQGIGLKELSVRNHFVDPPRSGLDSETEKCRRIHVFCISPAIRKRYARIWKYCQTHKVERLALFDQFPTRTIWSAAYY